MSLESAIVAAVYASAVAEDATYIDRAGAQTAVRLVTDQSAEDVLIASAIGARDTAHRFRVRKSQAPNVCRDDLIAYDGATYCVDEVDDLNVSEWLIYAVAKT